MNPGRCQGVLNFVVQRGLFATCAFSCTAALPPWSELDDWSEVAQRNAAHRRRKACVVKYSSRSVQHGHRRLGQNEVLEKE